MAQRSRRIVVDGHTFEVTRRPGRPGAYDFAWRSGPDPDYGFTSASSDGSSMTEADLERSIRNFLDQVDPETGHIE